MTNDNISRSPEVFEEVGRGSLRRDSRFAVASFSLGILLRRALQEIERSRCSLWTLLARVQPAIREGFQKVAEWTVTVDSCHCPSCSESLHSLFCSAVKGGRAFVPYSCYCSCEGRFTGHRQLVRRGRKVL